MNDAAHNSRVGTRLGQYQLRRLIGRGGMGEVYEAEDLDKGRVVALKLLPESLSHEPTFRERLQREARAAGRLQEPHVVPIHDYGEIDGHLYVDMRLIEGPDLRTVLLEQGAMTPARAVGVVRQIAAALDAAHAAGITHRDVKPENVLIADDDFAYLVDFGIATVTTDHTLTEQGAAIGTYAYMAPERFSSTPVTNAADVYSLACVLYQCLSGQQPYSAQSISMLITAHLIDPPPRPSHARPGIPPALDDVVAIGMAKIVEDRYATAGALARAAEAALGAPTVVDRPAAALVMTVPTAAQPTGAEGGPSKTVAAVHSESAAVRPTKQGHERRLLLAGGAVALILVLIAAGFVAWLVARSSNGTSGMATTLTINRTIGDDTRAPVDPTLNLTPGERQLLTLVPDATACTPNKKWENAIAAVDCKPTESGDGHERGFFALYGDVDDLDDDFKALTAEANLIACPGTDGSPTHWDYDSTPEAAEGSLACGDRRGRVELAWTKDSELLLGTGVGNNLDALYKWWVDIA